MYEVIVLLGIKLYIFIVFFMMFSIKFKILILFLKIIRV